MSDYHTIGELNEIVGLFTKYNEIKESHFTTLFGENLAETEIEALNNLVSDVYGDCVLSKNISSIFDLQGADKAVTRIMRNADILHFDSWRKAKESIDKVFAEDIEKPLTEERETTIESDGNTTSNRQNKANAYDTLTATDTESEESEGTSKDNTKRVDKIRRDNGKTASENATEVLDFVKYNYLIRIVLYDIMNYSCVGVYPQ